MALTYINAADDAVRGIPSNEQGYNAESIEMEFTPEVNDYLMGITGESISKAVSTIPQCRLAFSGEVLDVTAGPLAGDFATAIVPVNSTAYLDRVGGFYPDRITLGLARDGWKSISGEATSKPLIP